MADQDAESKNQYIERYRRVRQKTIEICRSLQTEDFVVQPASFVSPPKWHLAHTTWFFEKVLLSSFENSYQPFDSQFDLLFNSYYKSAGQHWIQSERGHLSRPTVDKVKAYRKHVDDHMLALMQSISDPSFFDQLLLGLEHEEQHQELLLMDIKYILGTSPMFPSYIEGEMLKENSRQSEWVALNEGVYEIGHQGQGFAFDNESPRHKHYQHGFEIRTNLVNNDEFLEFMDSGGYQKPEYWLSLGWDWVSDGNILAPLYWVQQDGQWFEYTLYGLQPLDPHRPVSHISYFEAQAYARWKGLRIPSEQEMEIYLTTYCQDALNPPTEQSLVPGQDNSCLQLWSWTQSAYSPYPGFVEFSGMAKEYNGKFMCNQYVLKGGCLATPKGHYRHTYRNFYTPEQRWMFSGIRLVKDRI